MQRKTKKSHWMINESLVGESHGPINESCTNVLCKLMNSVQQTLHMKNK